MAALSGLVLAGGASKRMGRDKAVLVYQGTPLAAHAVDVLAGICDDVVVASGDGRRLTGLGVAQVADAVAGAGPLGGLVAGLEAARHPLVAVLAVDMPEACGAVLRLLADAHCGEDVVVARVDGRLQPLHAVWSRACAPVLRERLADGRRSVAGALAALRVLVVDDWHEADPTGRFARNLNRPEDL